MASAERRLERERKTKENELKQQIILLRNLSLQVGEAVSCLFDKKKRTLTPLSEYYPGLFNPIEETNEMSLESYTDMFEDFAYRHNQRHNQNQLQMMLGGDTHE